MQMKSTHSENKQMEKIGNQGRFGKITIEDEEEEEEDEEKKKDEQEDERENDWTVYDELRGLIENPLFVTCY